MCGCIALGGGGGFLASGLPSCHLALSMERRYGKAGFRVANVVTRRCRLRRFDIRRSIDGRSKCCCRIFIQPRTMAPKCRLRLVQ